MFTLPYVVFSVALTVFIWLFKFFCNVSESVNVTLRHVLRFIVGCSLRLRSRTTFTYLKTILA